MLDRSAYRHARALGCAPAEAADIARRHGYWRAVDYMAALELGRGHARALCVGMPFLGASPLAREAFRGDEFREAAFRSGYLDALPRVMTRGDVVARLFRAVPSKPVNGRPSWRGIYSVEPGRWKVVCNRNGLPIEYMTPEAAGNAASLPEFN